MPVDPNIHLRRLVKIYEAVGGSRTKGFVLTEVLADENISDEEAGVEAEYMEGERWIEMITDNGPPFAQLTHAGVKAAQAYLASPLAGAPPRVAVRGENYGSVAGITLR
jgi:hypothetical protein